jgi:putative addiction module antidote
LERAGFRDREILRRLRLAPLGACTALFDALPSAEVRFLWSGPDGPDFEFDHTGHYNQRYYMAIETKVRRIGNSLGIVLPKEALNALKVEEGATLYLTEAPEGSLRVTPDQPGFAQMMALAEKGMRRYRNALRELAK